MPSRNRIKAYAPDSYYHVYNRGVEKRVIFLDDQDYTVFLSLLKRYLSGEEHKDHLGRIYEDLSDEIELLAFCLMPNHLHLLLYQSTERGITNLLQRVMTSYTMYFNRKYKRVGTLFQDRFKASRISRDEYLQHISRYMHLNPMDYKNWEFSSLPYYLGNKKAAWLKPGRILEMFGAGEYRRFVADYEDHKKMLDEVRDELANS